MTQHQQLAGLLASIEREMRLLELWQPVPPPPEALASTEPFCIDTLTFCEWVQWVMIPRFGLMIERQAALPASSDIATLAEEAFKQIDADTEALLVLIEEIDRTLRALH
ncbi:YqcC family protein [Marinobacterium aestuariivivens]|uniref:YqcC family protein n=1 Tax=Marinobacterium aestuariivivens TaxID=1698799 RepID=A0ABW1ZW53_9GAMM